ncbi:MAG TPA: nucleoside deaminase [Vicinamibacterales bacterium]|nr:nucleoside deaminase [Vicinamibacterales bacterium]
MPEPYTTIEVGYPDWMRDVVDWDATYATDDSRMRLAIELARQNVLRGTGGPFGAAVFESASGSLVSAGVNSVVRLNNSVLHAEVVAIMLAQRRLSSYTLHGSGLPQHEIVTSCDPCAMCLGAVLWSGVRRMVAGADRADASALNFDEGPVFPESHAYLEARGVAIARGVLRQEAAAVLELYRRQGGTIYNA